MIEQNEPVGQDPAKEKLQAAGATYPLPKTSGLQGEMAAAPVVTLQGVSVFLGSRLVLDEISLNISPGDFLGIIGPNGGGKTTLLKIMLGLLSPAAGKVALWGSTPVNSRHRAGYVQQRSEIAPHFPITVGEVVLSGSLTGPPAFFHRYGPEARERAEAALGKTGLCRLRHRPIAALSGGEFQKMLIARALVGKPELLLLDEPTSGVDAPSRSQVYELLKELNRDITVVLVSHDLSAISSHVQSLACLNKTLHYHGQPRLSETIIGRLYGCPVELIAHGVPHRVLGHHPGEDL